ncbi:MAG: hypothetical protein J2P28_09375 [Actinobacteria bacterium]|nr:hypothetical protein [Actinomycetota bacterium]
MKEFRAAGWSGKNLQWITGPTMPPAAGPVLYLSCDGNTTPAKIVIAVRIGLAHFVAATRVALPKWKVDFVARGVGGTLHLIWDLDTRLEDAVRSLVGPVPRRQTYASGRQFWDEHDGGISALTNGTWIWDIGLSAWRPGDDGASPTSPTDTSHDPN